MRKELRFAFDKSVLDSALAVANEVIPESEFAVRPYTHDFNWYRIDADVDQAERIMPALRAAGITFTTADVYAPGEYEAVMEQRRVEAEARIEANAKARREETKEEKIGRLVRERYIFRDCRGCDVFFDNPDAMAPRHNASSRCQSGKRPHCTCDTCW